MKDKVKRLAEILENSQYTVAICGSGMLEEIGFLVVKRQERAYEIEQKYGASPEYLFTSSYFQTRPEQFFDFYKTEMLNMDIEETESAKALAKLEAEGKLQCVISSNIYELSNRGGCKNVINLHGSVYNNFCTHCGKPYSIDYIKNSPGIPVCEDCKSIIRPQVSLFGEMLDSQLVTKTTLEIEKADTLLVLGTTLESEVFSNYIRYFEGRNMVIIHEKPHHSDRKADMVIIDQPKNILPLLAAEFAAAKETETAEQTKEYKEG